MQESCGFEPWVRKIPWSRHGNPLQYSCLGILWTEDPVRLHSMGSQRVRHQLETEYVHHACYEKRRWEVTGLCREVRQTKQAVNWQIKGANTKWRQQNNCLLLLTCGLSFHPSERFDSGLALTGSVVCLCEAAARPGLQRVEDSGGPGQGHLAATVSREASLHPGEPVPGEAGRGERWQ